ncbi:MAG TPA: nicotinate-nucleotide--dimethylbenzimidazole phosphoribosyltransferase [Candidatus Margulisiibacteriota bacterium]|nr:nicotinate-nucleotide--dimethylbenzimidazole phosphoribosyltransferase [Candidatus Margulisiibacteriota bacterium]
MTLLADTIASIGGVDPAISAATQRLLDAKTKPRRSLGRIEDLACRVAAIRGTPSPALPVKAIVVMGADHGVADEGVSAYPQAVTRQMLLNFAAGGAAINVLARQAGAQVVVVDMGVTAPLPGLDICARRVGPGTRNFTLGPAMSPAQAIEAVETGIQLAHELVAGGVTLLGTGEMGIANTTAASAIAAAFAGAAPEAVTGRGTGIDDSGWRRKIDVVRQALAVNRPDPADALDVLAKVGGFEIGGLAGVVLGGASRRVPVVVDGFIAGVAALLAVRLAPAAADYLIAAHQSVEIGHRLVLELLGLRPLLDLELRLGEGTGVALAMSLVDAALRVLHEMATFENAGVSDAGA